MTFNFIVRPYRPGDRDSLRRLAVDTADRGNPSKGLFDDPVLLADLLTDPYLRDHPAHTWVVESEGRVVGYLTGCLDTAVFQRRLAMFLPGALARAAGRGTFFRTRTWKTLARLRWADLRGYRAPNFLRRYPGHLHLNIAPEGRGRGAGRVLLDAFLSAARAAGTRGVHLGTRLDNPHRSFFEKNGFVEIGRATVPSFQSEGPRTDPIVVYGRQLS